MTTTATSRYNNVAISLHWLMALLIIGMLAVGKFMVWLPEADPLRFTLTQWHKTFGVLILLLTVFRLLWRFTHRAPAHPTKAPRWEHFAANASHIALYSLLFIAPVTGWMLVSVSPLNLDTLLFNVVPWPHLPWLHNIADKAAAVGQYAQFHEWATGALIALLLLHVAAALKHHFINKDTVLTRILPSAQAGTGKTMAGFIAGLVLLVGGSVLGYAKLNTTNSGLSSGTSVVSATVLVTNTMTLVNFTESTVTAAINPDDLDGSTLSASVPTATVTSKNAAVESGLPEPEWFDSENYPEATFLSTKISAAGEFSYNVEGNLTIKGIIQSYAFTLNITDVEGKKTASGEFVVDRTEYELGLESQPNDDSVGLDVTIAFEFELLEESN